MLLAAPLFFAAVVCVYDQKVYTSDDLEKVKEHPFFMSRVRKRGMGN